MSVHTHSDDAALGPRCGPGCPASVKNPAPCPGCTGPRPRPQTPKSTPDRLVFAARLKSARESAGWTQDGAAAALGMNRVAYGDYERGKRTPTALRLMTFVRVLGLDPKAIVPEWFA